MEFTKDLRRGDRRWRSFTKFMRRLRQDWNEHRWNWNPRRYGSLQGLTAQGACSIWADTDLCPCFYDPGMAGWARFKDTPHRKCSGYECDPRRATHGVSSRTIQEWRAEEAPENHSTRKRRDGIRLAKITCMRCGFLIKKQWVRHGQYVSHWNVKCPACEEAAKRKMMYWRGKELIEFDKPA